MNKMRSTLLMIIAIIFGIISCSDNTSEPNNTQSIIGTWSKLFDSHKVSLKFNSDGTIWSVYESELNEDFGYYSINNDNITIHDNECDIEETGIYKFTITGTNLQFTLISDECESRAEEIVDGYWEKE